MHSPLSVRIVGKVDTWTAAAMLYPGRHCRRQEVLGGHAGPGNCGPTYSAIVGATIVFDFSKIIIRGPPILGWIRLLEPCSVSGPESPNDSRPNPQRLGTNITRTKQSWDLGKEGGRGRTRRAGAG